MAKKKFDWNSVKSNPVKLEHFRRNFIKNGLRRLSYRWYGRFNALKKYKIGYNEYYCGMCGVINGKRYFQLDHIIPVVNISGWLNFDDFINKLFCVEEGWQLLCKDTCHLEKSLKENVKRRTIKKRTKK